RIYSDVFLSACSFQSSVNINGQSRMLRRLFISGDYIDGVLNIHNSDIAIRGFIIEVNPGGNVGYFSKYSTVGNNNFTGKAFAFKIKNAPIAFRLHQAAFNSGVDEIILQNCEHFLEISSEPVFLDLPELMNSTPNADYFTNTNKLIDLQTGTRINIPGLYPEYDSQQKLIVTVTNPTTLIVGNNSFNSFIEFEYTALRGILPPISGIINLNLTDDKVYQVRNEQYGEDIGLNFTSNLNSGNSQLVELVLTALDNEYDDNIIVNYKIKRLMQ
ncbi:MAG: hypothetical protein MI922_01985, partial [Bacteroidales bacterium]|nr:hypothetical protein [Bacteroidales bacterium]